MPANVAAWWETYCTIGGEPLSLTEAQESSPLLVAALLHLSDTMARRRQAEWDLRSKRDGSRGTG